MDANAEREKKWAASSSVVAAIFLTLMKLVVGVATGSLGILAEAAHSALDLVAAIVTWFAVRFSGRPADKQHQYGHGKIENLSALFETFLLLVTCAWIIYEAIQRLFFESVEVEVNIWSFLVMGISIVIDISRSRMLLRTAKKYDSQALEADGLHFSTDVWSSSVVIGGLVCVWLSNELGIPWLAKADAVAALMVAVIVIWVSLQLGKRTVDGLLDTAPDGLTDRIEGAVAGLAGVEHVDTVRVRRSGPETFADVTISVARSQPLDEAHDVASSVEEAVRSVVSDANVMVHTDPHDDIENTLQHVHLIAHRQRLEIHNLAVQEISGHKYVALDLEVAPDLSLGEAHSLASNLEAHLREDIPGIVRIDTHIEPRPQSVMSGHEVTADSPQIVAAVREAVSSQPFVAGCHSITVFRSDGHYTVSVHCTFDPHTSIRDVHEASDQVSHRVMDMVPSVSRVIVHPEP